MHNQNFNFLISQLKHVVNTQKSRLNEAVLLGTPNLCYNRWIRKYSQFYAKNCLCSFWGCIITYWEETIFLLSDYGVAFYSLLSSIALLFLVSSVDNFCKQFGPRSGPTKRRVWSGSKLFDTNVFSENFSKSRAWSGSKLSDTTWFSCMRGSRNFRHGGGGGGGASRSIWQKKNSDKVFFFF